MKKNLYILSALIGISLALLSVIQKQSPNKKNEPSDGLQVIGLIQEKDCLACVEKLICNWERLETRFADSKVELVFVIQSDIFQMTDLEYLCDLPKSITGTQSNDLVKDLNLLATPAITITNGRHILFLEPIYPDTNLDLLFERVESMYTDYSSRNSI